MGAQIFWFFFLSLVSYMLAPKPEQANPSTKDQEAPTASASKPIPVVFGTVFIKEANVVWWGDAGTSPIRTKGGKK